MTGTIDVVTEERGPRAMIFRRQTEEQRREQDAAREAAETARRKKKFQESPAGRARASFESGAEVFQIILTLRSRFLQSQENDVNGELNSVIAEGWQLHSFSTSSAIHSDSNLNGLYAVTSTLLGTYVFVRRPERR